MTDNKQLRHLLSIDDDADTRDLITFTFENEGYVVTALADPAEGIRAARTTRFAAIITDYHFAGVDGTDLCRAIRTFNGLTPLIFFTGETRPAQRQAALTAGAQAYLTKPDDFERLVATINNLLATGD